MSECRNVGQGASLESVAVVGISVCRFTMLLHNASTWMILSEYQKVGMGGRYHYICCNVVVSDESFESVILIVNVLFFIPVCRYIGCRTYRVILFNLLLLNCTCGKSYTWSNRYADIPTKCG